MANDTQTPLQIEWAALHRSYDQFDVLGLVIKLVAVVIAIAGLITALDTLIITALIAVLWLQEAIWKTFQGRTEQRLIAIEKALSTEESPETISFYGDWQASRPGTVGLIKEYLANALRPTIAYPYVLLIAIAIVACFL
ncbi:hypothetical protein A9Q99_24085 [Gammaproteobacteria bacterium 45_16_T64]|nr:hypothetical protein A9Q99_24085 [Gammaproteobacteria bacterium 45_16_T64]